MPSLSSIATLALFGAAAAQPAMPGSYQLSLNWQQATADGKTYDFMHNRWYDITNQLYRDDTVLAGSVTEKIIQRPTLDFCQYDYDIVRNICKNTTNAASIDGFVLFYGGMTSESDIVDGVQATKWSKALYQYNISIWVASGDSTVADGTPIQVYNSYDEQTGTHVGGLTHITSYNTTLDKDAFVLDAICEHPQVPTPAPAPTPSPVDAPHYLRNWASKTCDCMKVSYTGLYQNYEDCMSVECPA